MAKTAALLILALLGTVCTQDYSLPPPVPNNLYAAPSLRSSSILEEDPLEALAVNIPGGGVPGQDYPILASVVDTGFNCLSQGYPGYFADTAGESGCQVFHICQFDGRQDSFLCPNGTVFNQQYFVCDWWFNVDCAASDQFRSLNQEIGKLMEDTAADASSRSEAVEPSQLYGVPEVRQAAPPSPPSNTYSAPEIRQAAAPAPPPTQFYSSPNRF